MTDKPHQAKAQLPDSVLRNAVSQKIFRGEDRRGLRSGGPDSSVWCFSCLDWHCFCINQDMRKGVLAIILSLLSFSSAASTKSHQKSSFALKSVRLPGAAYPYCLLFHWNCTIAHIHLYACSVYRVSRQSTSISKGSV